MQTDDPNQFLPFQRPLWADNEAPEATSALPGIPRMTFYRPSPEAAAGQCIVICPGGGYQHLSVSKEGHRPAQFLAAHGIASAVLEYRHKPYRQPVPLIDAQRAIVLMRHYSAQWGLAGHAVGIMGFSAGGHLAGSAATTGKAAHPAVFADLQNKEPCVRPDFGVLIYPVVSFTADCAHVGSRDNLLGQESTSAVRKAWSIEERVDESTPPLFLVHTSADTAVPPENSLLLYAAMRRHRRLAEVHVYPEPGHGFGMADSHPWPGALLQWLRLIRTA